MDKTITLTVTAIETGNLSGHDLYVDGSYIGHWPEHGETTVSVLEEFTGLVKHLLGRGWDES
jgi:hypothetical protein